MGLETHTHDFVGIKGMSKKVYSDHCEFENHVRKSFLL